MANQLIWEGELGHTPASLPETGPSWRVGHNDEAIIVVYFAPYLTSKLILPWVLLDQIQVNLYKLDNIPKATLGIGRYVTTYLRHL